MISQTLYTLEIAFLQPYRDHYHPEVTDTELGVYLSMFYAVQLIFSPISGIYQERVGRKRMILIGLALEILAAIGFGCLVLLGDDE
jgi:MFS family permease